MLHRIKAITSRRTGGIVEDSDTVPLIQNNNLRERAAVPVRSLQLAAYRRWLRYALRCADPAR